MELTSVEKIEIIPDTGQCEHLPLTLVNELLATILAEEDEKILVEGGSKNFMYDTDSVIRVDDTLKATVEHEKVTQQESTIEITLSGTLKNKKGNSERYTLYFFMWWDHTQSSPLQTTPLKKIRSMPVYIHPQDGSKHLSDSVFELDLFRKEGNQDQQYLGQGRGYLVFGRSN